MPPRTILGISCPEITSEAILRVLQTQTGIVTAEWLPWLPQSGYPGYRRVVTLVTAEWLPWLPQSGYPGCRKAEAWYLRLIA